MLLVNICEYLIILISVICVYWCDDVHYRNSLASMFLYALVVPYCVHIQHVKYVVSLVKGLLKFSIFGFFHLLVILPSMISVTPLEPVVPRVGPGHPSSPCPFTSSSFPLFYFSLSFIGFTYFLLLSIHSLSTGIVPLRFQAGGRRRRPNLGLVCVLLCNLCYLYSLVKTDCGVLFHLV